MFSDTKIIKSHDFMLPCCLRHDFHYMHAPLLIFSLSPAAADADFSAFADAFRGCFLAKPPFLLSFAAFR